MTVNFIGFQKSKRKPNKLSASIGRLDATCAEAKPEYPGSIVRSAKSFR